MEKKMNPRVSVLIPAYNHEKYVQDTIKSIIEQTYKNIELIVIDDGSKDSTWQKIQEMKDVCEKRFERIHFETKENEGTCRTLNKLLSLAQGDYVYIIASDDLAKTQAIEKEVEFLKNNVDYALVVGDNEFIDGNSQICYWDKNENLVYSNKEAKYTTFSTFLQADRNINFVSELFGTYKTLFLNNYIPNGYLIRKSIFVQTGFFTSDAPLEDWYLMLQISKYAKMKYLDEILFSYRQHSTNTIKDTEKISYMTKKTRQYEEKILNEIDEKMVFKEVVDIKKYGLCYKKQGIPFFFQILSYKKIEGSKYKIIIFLGIKVNLKSE